LCGCGCHSACLVPIENSTAGDLGWRLSCTCPGAEAVRGILDAGVALPFGVRDFAAKWAESRDEFKSRREAFKAAQASAAGQDREQRRLKIAEYSALTESLGSYDRPESPRRPDPPR
jgi:hypothetical protein